MYTLTRGLVRCFSVVIVLLICAFVFLRTHGVPKPILRALVSRVNKAGVPVDVEHVQLTLRGWRARNVSYFSPHPDDLDPIITVNDLLIRRQARLDGEVAGGLMLDVEATGIAIHPSVEWGVEIPGDSALSRVDAALVSIGFTPGRVELAGGRLSWLGMDCEVDGVIAWSPDLAVEKRRRRAGEPPPVWMPLEEFRAWEARFQRLSLRGATSMNIDFNLDVDDLERARASVELSAREVSLRNVAFDAVNLDFRYEEHSLLVERLVARKNNETIEVGADYDLRSGLLRVDARNGVTSNELLLIAPQPVLDVLVKAELFFEELPRFRLKLGPAKPLELLNHLSGSFAVQSMAYRGLEIESLRGDLRRENHRLDIENARGVARGQEERADEVGSSMRGGVAEGEVYWDARARSFGVHAAGSMDPNLLLRPLDIVPVATNVINRFKFNDEPPEIELRLGSCYTNWADFFIDIQATASDAWIHDAELSSVSVSAYYQHAVLELDPIAAVKGVDFLKGSGAIHFKKDTAMFDVFGSMPPAVIENAVYPGYDIFSKHVLAKGDVRVKASGRVEWGTMRNTRFLAEVEAERVEIPIAELDAFSGRVVGDGRLLSVTNAAFGLYGGTGKGEFRVVLDPATNTLPYEMEFTMLKANFKECLGFFRDSVDQRIKGVLSGEASFSADLGRGFFETANGKGSVKVAEGELTDLPFFSGFSQLMRRVIPGFKVFSITNLEGDFTFEQGVIRSRNAYFEGDVISAKAQGGYSKKEGFDARVQVQILRDNRVSRVFRAITDPIFKLFEMRLTGPLSDPKWRLDNFSSPTVVPREKK